MLQWVKFLLLANDIFNLSLEKTVSSPSTHRLPETSMMLSPASHLLTVGWNLQVYLGLQTACRPLQSAWLPRTPEAV